MPSASVVRPILKLPLRSGGRSSYSYILFEGGTRPILGLPFCSRKVLTLFYDGHSVRGGCSPYSRTAILSERGARPFLGRPFC